MILEINKLLYCLTLILSVSENGANGLSLEQSWDKQKLLRLSPGKLELEDESNDGVFALREQLVRETRVKRREALESLISIGSGCEDDQSIEHSATDKKKRIVKRFSGSSGSSPDSGKDFPHDIKTKARLRKLYNKEVVSVQSVERPLNGLNKGRIGELGVKLAKLLGIKTSISGQKDRATHSGVLVTTKDGGRYLVHKGKDFGKSSQTVVVDAKHMSKLWKKVGKSVSGNGKKIGDFVKAGGKDYKIKGGNCHNAIDKMKELG